MSLGLGGSHQGVIRAHMYTIGRDLQHTQVYLHGLYASWLDNLGTTEILPSIYISIFVYQCLSISVCDRLRHFTPIAFPV
jgi:hypothetical protein